MTEMTAAKLVGGNVRAELARAGQTQAWLAGVLGLSQQQASERLRGKVAFRVDELIKVADALGVPVAALMPEPSKAAS
jgi:transcriptional regulator with XRE-family HTH domain